MAKFYVFQSTKDAQGEAIATTKKEYDDAERAEREALMLYHQILASAYANAGVTNILCKIFGEFGQPIKDEYWGTPEEIQEQTGE